MLIEVISVDVQTKPTAKGSYQVAEVTYKKDGKVNGKKVMSFGNTANAFKVISQASKGEFFEVTQVKEGEYWNWTNVVKVDDNGGNAGASAPARSGPATNASPKSTYETPEERAAKQVYIARQSSITAALKTLELQKSSPSREEVVELAAYYLDWVMTGEIAQVEAKPARGRKPAKQVEELSDDLPFDPDIS